MDYKKINTQRRIARSMGFVGILGAIMAASPWIFNIDPMEGGGALVLVGLLLALTGLLTYFIFNHRAKLVNDMFAEKNVLAHWKINGMEWAQFAEEDVNVTRSNAWKIWGLITFFFVLFTGFFRLLMEDMGEANFFTMMMAGIWLFISIFAFLATAIRNRKRQSQKDGEVIISKNGLWLNGEAHIWKGMGSDLDWARYYADKRILEFSYSFPARYGRQSVEVRVPVPNHVTKELEAVMTFFGLFDQKSVANPIKENFSAEENSFPKKDKNSLTNEGFEVKM